MEDEKVLCVLEEVYDNIKSIDDISLGSRLDIHWFFTNYKNNTAGKWSKVQGSWGYQSKEEAISLYNRSIF